VRSKRTRNIAVVVRDVPSEKYRAADSVRQAVRDLRYARGSAHLILVAAGCAPDTERYELCETLLPD
jgi:hypothetical protein